VLMAEEKHVALLRQGVEVWNKWRKEKPDLGRAHLSELDLSKANLYGADLSRANLYGANLYGANLSEANLYGADLSKADLSGADLSKAYLFAADLSGANLSGVNLFAADLSGVNLSRKNLSGANLSGADLSKAYLSGADLKYANLVEADFTDADLTSCHIYGISAWGLKLSKDTKQRNLVITKPDESEITVDDIEVAQFIYLLLHNEKIRNVIDTIGKKGVLLLGRFTGGRIAILNKLREEIRNRGYVPIVFNFERPEKSDFTETIRTLAGLCRFIIADITNPRSTPLEMQAVVPEYMVPFVPIIEEGQEPFAMFKDLWVKHSA
jgi:uncharacterized protein YjbI with pentapeptide repeats